MARIHRDPDDETLRRLYVDELKSMAKIARLYGVSPTSVMTWIREAGVPARSLSKAISLGKKGRPASPEHRKKLAENLKKARAAITEDSYEKQRVKMQGREPPNKGERWSEEIHAKHSYRQTDEYREAMADRHRGEKSYLWQGGQLSENDQRLRTWQWRQRRMECYERDRWTCQDCGVHCTNRGKSKIQAHHLVARRDGGSDELGNLVTLCSSCHAKRDWHRPRG